MLQCGGCLVATFLFGGLKANACILRTLDCCRYLGGPLSLDSKPVLLTVPCHNACDKYAYTTMACWHDMGLTPSMLQISPSKTSRFNSSDHKAGVEHGDG